MEQGFSFTLKLDMLDVRMGQQEALEALKREVGLLHVPTTTESTGEVAASGWLDL